MTYEAINDRRGFYPLSTIDQLPGILELIDQDSVVWHESAAEAVENEITDLDRRLQPLEAVMNDDTDNPGSLTLYTEYLETEKGKADFHKAVFISRFACQETVLNSWDKNKPKKEFQDERLKDMYLSLLGEPVKNIYFLREYLHGIGIDDLEKYYTYNSRKI